MRTITILLIAFLLTSCNKEENTISLSIDYVYYRETKKDLPLTAIMTTDKEVFHFELINHSGGGSSNTIQIQPDTYRVLDVTLYSEEGKPTHYVMQQPTGDGQGKQPTSWVGELHNLESDISLLWNVLEIN